MNYLTEICIDSVDSALTAQAAGADRVELCDNLTEGGTTPSFGMIATVRSNIDISLNVIIRPRGGDFLYNDIEYDVMRRDIDICGESGVNGIVIGILTADGRIDLERTSRLVECARPMSVTFHRAFDLCADPFAGLEAVIAAGADRLLTSGLKNKAADGAGLIAELVNKAGKRIIIMPGSGIKSTNIALLAQITGAHEFHFTGREKVESMMVYRRSGISMGGTYAEDEFLRKTASFAAIKSCIDALKAAR